jgi:ectoine hydroxylase-related dioxygenase (phytanoyl-CoA dioxygenase family)
MGLKRFSSGASPAALVETLRTDGALIVENVLARGFVARALDEVAPAIARTPTSKDSFSGTRTTRTGALVARSAACREVVMNAFALEAAKLFLAPWCERIQLHLTQITRILPGQGHQPLHRDRVVWGPFLPASIEPQFNMIWALTEFTAENGATRVAPGSQNWPKEREPKPEEIDSAVMPAGSVLIFTGTVLHSGGENRASDPRVGLNIDYCLSWLRQEENQYLSCPPDIARALDPDLQDLLGYTMGGFALGYFSRLDQPGISAPEGAVGREPRAAATAQYGYV